MKNWIPALLLALASPSLLAAPETVADVLKDLSTHGYVSPPAAVARLEAAQGAGDANAPIDERRRYEVALVWLSLAGRDTALQARALQALQGMADGGKCTPCRASWLIGKAEADIVARKLESARTRLDQAATLIKPAEPDLELTLAQARMRLEQAQGAMNVAFREAMTALKLAEGLDDNARRIELLDRLATINAGLGFLDRAVTQADAAAAQAQAAGFTAALGLVRIDQGYIYALRNERPKQFVALNQALDIARSHPGLDYLKVIAHANLSDYYLELHDEPSALQQAQDGAKLARSLGDSYGESVALVNQGIALTRMGKTAEGLALMHQSLTLSAASNRLQLELGINQEIVKALEAVGRYREAVQVMRDADTVNQKITRQERDNAMLELQAKYDDERKTREIERLSTQAKLQDAEASARRWQQRMWVVLAAVAVAIALLMILRLVHARRANRKLVDDVASLTEQSAVDALTGMLNRRGFAALMQPNRRAADTWMGLAMVDIDHFKQVNDSLGHDTGDVVLQELARRLKSLGRRSNDHAARWGGEEFVLAFPDVSPQSLASLARRVLDVVAEAPFPIGTRLLNISVSIGFVAHPLAPASEWEQALRLADAAMYRAKRAGRNRAVCVTAVNDPGVGHLAELDIDALIQSGAVTVAEIAGPVAVAPAIA